MKGSRIVVFYVLAAGLLLMFFTSFLQNLSGEPMVQSPPSAGAPPRAARDEAPAPGPDAPAGMPGTLAPEDAARMGEFMARLQSNPHDADLLLEIAQAFMRAKEWPQAESFLRRASVAAPTDARPPHFLGVIQASRQQYTEAAASFEQALTLDTNPSTQFNLAVLYRYYLNKPDRAKTLLEAVSKSADAPDALKAKAAQELQNLKAL